MGVDGNFAEVVGVGGIVLPTKALAVQSVWMSFFLPSHFVISFYCSSFFYCWFQPRTLSTCHSNIALHVVRRPSYHPEGSNAGTTTTLSRILFSLRSPHEFRLHTKENKFSNIIIHTPNWITKIDTTCWIDWSTSKREWLKSHEIHTTLKMPVFVYVTPCRL